jgi:hypothetical protein
MSVTMPPNAMHSSAMPSGAASSYSAKKPDEYLETRVNYKTEAYNRKGKFYKYCFLASSTLMMVSAAMVPVAINLEGVPKLVPTLLSLLVTVLVGVEGVFHFREHWKNYDLIKSFLRQEGCMFQAGAGIYREKSDSERFLLLVERVEDAIAKERSQTIEMRTARTPVERKVLDAQGAIVRPPNNG